MRRRKLHRRRRIVADAIKDRIVQPRRQRLHPGRPRAISANNSARRNLLLLPQLPRRRHPRLRANNGGNGLSVRHNPHKLRRLHPLPRLQQRRHRRLRANNAGNGLSVHRNRCKPRRLRLLPQLLRHRHRRLRANGVSSARHKPRRLHPPRHRHRCLRANNGGNGLSVHRNRRKPRRLRLQRQSRLPLRQRLRQNQQILIRTKNRTATGKTTGPVRPDPVHRRMSIAKATGCFRQSVTPFWIASLWMRRSKCRNRPSHHDYRLADAFAISR